VTKPFVAVAKVDEIAINSSKAFFVSGVDVLVCNARGEFHAIKNLCTHQRAKLEGGRIRNCAISCPLHGVIFNLKTGVPRGQLTNVPVEVFEVRVVDGQVEVAV
jgi:3-phenylpropionate/trans-cinnamate dioxygenase ferredoxin subunit